MAKVLVVDDSPTIRFMMGKWLKADGHTTLEAADGAEALKIAKAHTPDLILLDVILPKRNGFQVCRKLKADPLTEAIPVVMITSKDDEDDRDWGIEQGADAYITKPVEEAQLRDAVRRLVEVKTS